MGRRAGWTVLLAAFASASIAAAQPSPAESSAGDGSAVAAVTPQQFRAHCDGRSDDNGAFQDWWNWLTSHHAEGYIPPGHCVISAPLAWDLTSRADGIRIRGAGQGATVLDLTGVRSGTPLRISGGKPLFYGHFSDFTVLTNIPGAGVQLGAPDFHDALNGFTFQQIEFKNLLSSPSAVALQLNGVFNSDFSMITANTGGGLRPVAAEGSSSGVALQLRKAAFNRFMGSFSNAAIGVHLTSDYVFANTFDSLDVEVVNRAVVIDSPKASRNTFTGGSFVAVTAFDFQQGNANLVINPNASILHGGRMMGGTAGLALLAPGSGSVETPPLPGSGEAIANGTGRSVWVAVNGGHDYRIMVGGSTYVGVSTVILQPGDTIRLVYAGTPPSWTWRPVL